MISEIPDDQTFVEKAMDFISEMVGGEFEDDLNHFEKEFWIIIKGNITPELLKEHFVPVLPVRLLEEEFIPYTLIYDPKGLDVVLDDFEVTSKTPEALEINQILLRIHEMGEETFDRYLY